MHDDDVWQVADPAVVARMRVAIGRLNRQLARSYQNSMTFAQMSALVAISEREPIRLGELAQVEQVAAPSMTRTLATLIADGLVRKDPDPQDGRSWQVALTPKGARLLADMRQARSAAMAERMARLTSEQYAVLAEALPVLEMLAADEWEPPRALAASRVSTDG
jgi:DNA-binding MarR family transcriptional regulator